MSTRETRGDAVGTIGESDVLIVVDIQNDFLPGGALGVSDGDAVVPVANALMERFSCVIATQDWHPADHGSFASQHAERAPGDVIDLHGVSQVLWPDHCVQGSSGASFASRLNVEHIDAVVRKGSDVRVDSYSGFFDNDHVSETGLNDLLRARGVRRVFVCGLAADYCVKFTALDAAALGYETVLLTDATRAVNLQPGDFERAMAEVAAAGVTLADSSTLG